jgi:hypothetical protein
VLHAKRYYGDKIKENEIGRDVERTEKRKIHTEFLWENRRGKEYLKDVFLKGRMISKWILDKGDVDWIDLAQDRENSGLL